MREAPAMERKLVWEGSRATQRAVLTLAFDSEIGRRVFPIALRPVALALAELFSPFSRIEADRCG